MDDKPTIAEFDGPRFPPGTIVYLRARVRYYTRPKPGEHFAWIESIDKEGNVCEPGVMHYVHEHALIAKETAVEEVKGGCASTPSQP